MKHELKILPHYYCRVVDGSKTFEVRNNDRGFQPDDEVELREFDICNFEDGYTSSPRLKFKIGYVLPIDAKRVVFSLLPIEKVK